MLAEVGKEKAMPLRKKAALVTEGSIQTHGRQAAAWQKGLQRKRESPVCMEKYAQALADN